MNILISGGTGFLGQKSAIYLSKISETNIYILSRNQDSSKIRQAFDIIEVTQLNSEKYKNYFDVIINFSGAPIFAKKWTESYKKQILESRIISTQYLVNFINNQNRKPLVFINASATGIYGNCFDKPVTEDYQFIIRDFVQEVVQQWEYEALKANCRTVLLRTSFVLDKDYGALKTILQKLRFGINVWFGNGDQFFPWIHVYDFVRIVEFCILNENVCGPVNVASPANTTNKEFFITLSKYEKTLISFGVSKFLVKLMFGERASLLLYSQKIIPKKLLENNFEFYYSSLKLAFDNLFLSDVR